MREEHMIVRIKEMMEVDQPRPSSPLLLSTDGTTGDTPSPPLSLSFWLCLLYWSLHHHPHHHTHHHDHQTYKKERNRQKEQKRAKILKNQKRKELQEPKHKLEKQRSHHFLFSFILRVSFTPFLSSTFCTFSISSSLLLLFFASFAAHLFSR